MKRRKLTVILSILTGTLLTLFAVFSVSAYSDDDPLITLSYLQQIFAPSFKQEIITEVTGTLQDDTEPETIPAATESENVPENIDNITNNISSNTYTLLELSLGQTVMADSICEFIVRPGSKVTAVSPFPSQGIADITNGIEVLGGEQIAINAYCLIPRGADGRGLAVISDKAYIMIRGEYTIG